MSRNGSISTTCEVFVSDVLDELTDEDLQEELAARKIPLNREDAAGFETVLEMMRRRDYDEAELLLERLLHPKFKDLSHMMKALAELKRKAA